MADLEKPEVRLAGLGSPDVGKRIAAVRACAKAGDANALEPLRKLAGEDPSMEVRYQARVALNAIRKTQGSGAFVRPQPTMPADADADDLRRMLHSTDPAERTIALREAVLHDEAPELLDDVLSRIPLETVADVRAQLVTSLAEMGGREVREQVAGFLRDPDARVRANAVEAVETLGDPRLLELVAKALQDPDHRVKLNAVVALDHAGKLSLLRCAEKIMRDPNYWLRDAAMYCVAHARLPDAVPLLARGLSDPHEPVRAKARAALEGFAESGVAGARAALDRPPAWDPTPDPWFAGLTPSPAPGDAPPAIDEGHIPLILDRLRTETDAGLIARLIGILGALGNPVVVPILVDFSKFPHPEVCRVAAISLRRLGAEHLVPVPAVASGTGPRAATGPTAAPVAPTPVPPAPPAPPPSGSPAPLIAVAVIALGAAVAWFALSSPRPPAPVASPSATR